MSKQGSEITNGKVNTPLKLIDNHEEFFSASYKNNFDEYKSYLDYRPVIFMELAVNIGEAVRCLTIEANTATITLTNYILERLLKLALIEDEMQLRPLTHPWKDCWDKMYPYFDLDMHETINQCARKQIISGKQKRQLLKYKNVFRNGFSHAAPDLIFKDYPETFKTSYYDGMDDVTHNLKKDPRQQLVFLQKIAKENAHIYFKYVFELIDCIELNLQKKYPGNLVLVPMEGGGFLRLSAKGWQKKINIGLSLPKEDSMSVELMELLLNQFNAKFSKVFENDECVYDIIFEEQKDFEEYKKVIKLIARKADI